VSSSRMRNRKDLAALDRLVPLAAVGALLTMLSYILEFAFEAAGISPASTLVDNITLGILGAFLVSALLRAREERDELKLIKARLELVGELNRQIRGPLAAMSRSILLDNREERLRCADDALERIDHVLNLSLPAIGAATAARAQMLQ